MPNRAYVSSRLKSKPSTNLRTSSMPPPPPSRSGWDPILLISQIISMQALHYLTLSILIPPLLSIFAEQDSLNYEGGGLNVGMVMDWREMAGLVTVPGLQGGQHWAGAYSGGKKLNVVGSNAHGEASLSWDGRIDPARGWVIAACWLFASCVDIYYMYTLVRRPRLVLDFALTLLAIHTVLTSYYSAALPTSLFFWLIMFFGGALVVVCTEQLCVRREMREGLNVAGVAEGTQWDGSEPEFEEEHLSDQTEHIPLDLMRGSRGRRLNLLNVGG